MSKMFRIFSFLMFSILCAGCATMAKGPSYSEAKATQLKPGYAILYVFRENAEPTAWGATVQIDGKPLAELNQGGFSWAYVKPGKRELKAVWAGLSGQHDSFISVDLAKGKTYYVDLTGISQASGFYGGAAYFKMGSGLNLVNPESAEKRINTCCKFQKPMAEVY